MKRDAPAARRNLAPIGEALDELLAGIEGDLLEVGCGSGQHAVGLAPRHPSLIWWPTDPDPEQRASTDAWRAEVAAPNLRTARELDASSPAWPLGGADEPPARLAAIYSANVIHIAPIEVMLGLMAGAGRHLDVGGRLLLYGPFRIDGAHHAPSNAEFDASLRERDPRWGIRDIEEIDVAAHEAGLVRTRMLALPANNHLLCFERERESHAQ